MTTPSRLARLVSPRLVLAVVMAALLGLASPVAAASSGPISGRVLLPDGSPASDFVIWIDAEGTSVKWNGRTDTRGNYKSASLPGGYDWNVHVMMNGRPYGPQIRWDVPAGSTGVNFRLLDPAGKIVGKVVDGKGNAVPNLRISAFDVGKTGPWTWNVGTTDGNGWYEIKRLDPSERYMLFYGGAESFAAVKSGKTTRLDLHLGRGYWIVTDRGVIHPFGSVPDVGDGGFRQRIMAVTATRSGQGLWLLDQYGEVHTFGDAKHHGSVKERVARGEIGSADLVAISATKSGNGYWILDSEGGIHTFGDAKFYGSIPGLRQKGQQIGQAEVVGLATTPSGRGYWVLDDQGGMFTFGDAKFYGSIPGLRQKGQRIGKADVVAMTPTATGRGYWLLDDQGGMFTFGDARFYGSVPWMRSRGATIGQSTMVDMVPTASGRGYYIVDYAGGIFTFGDAVYQGSLPAKKAGGPAAGIALAG